MSDEPARRSKGVHTHIGAYHILHGVDLAVPRGPAHHAAGPQRRRQDHHAAHHHGPVACVARARRRFGGRDITALHDAADRRSSASPMCPRTWASSPTSRCKENMLLAARGARRAEPDGRRAAEVDLLAVPGGGEVLEPPGRQALGRAKADAGGGARHRRAARAADRRRAQQGPGAGHHQQHDRRLRELKAQRRDHPAGRAEHQLRQAPGRHRRRDGQRPRGAQRHHGGAGRRRGCSNAAGPGAGTHRESAV